MDVFEQLAEAQKALIAIAVTKVDNTKAVEDLTAIKAEAVRALKATGYDEDMLAMLGIGLKVTGNFEA